MVPRLQAEHREVRALHGIHDVGHADRAGVSCQPAPAAGATERFDQPGLVKVSELLLEEPQRNALRDRDLPRRDGPLAVTESELHHRPEGVLRLLRNPKHPTLPSGRVFPAVWTASPLLEPGFVDLAGNYTLTVGFTFPRDGVRRGAWRNARAGSDGRSAAAEIRTGHDGHRAPGGVRLRLGRDASNHRLDPGGGIPAWTESERVCAPFPGSQARISPRSSE